MVIVKKIFYGFVCGLALGIWFHALGFQEYSKNLQNYKKNLSEKNQELIEKNQELIQLHHYIHLLQKKSVQPAPFWAKNYE